MSSENWWLEDYSTFEMVPFSGDMLIFCGGVVLHMLQGSIVPYKVVKPDVVSLNHIR